MSRPETGVGSIKYDMLCVSYCITGQKWKNDSSRKNCYHDFCGEAQFVMFRHRNHVESFPRKLLWRPPLSFSLFEYYKFIIIYSILFYLLEILYDVWKIRITTVTYKMDKLYIFGVNFKT